MKTRFVLFAVVLFAAAFFNFFADSLLYPIATEQVATQQFEYDGSMHPTRILSKSQDTVGNISTLVVLVAGVLLFGNPTWRWLRSQIDEANPEHRSKS